MALFVVIHYIIFIYLLIWGSWRLTLSLCGGVRFTQSFSCPTQLQCWGCAVLSLGLWQFTCWANVRVKMYHTKCVSQFIDFGQGWTILLCFLFLQDLQSNFLRDTVTWYDQKKYQEALTRDEVCKASQGTIDKKIKVKRVNKNFFWRNFHEGLASS